MTDTSATTPHAAGAQLVLAAACLGTLVVSYNTTAIITALPAIKADLDIDSVTLQWVMNSYLLASATIVAVMGRIADIIGKMRLFLAGLACFAVGSLCLIVASDAALLLAGRIAQGIGAAALFSTSVALVNVATPEDQRAFAVGLWGGMIAFGFGIGPVLGGLLTDFASWRIIFVLDLLFLAAAMFIGLRIRKSGFLGEPAHKGETIDYLGVALLVVTLGSLVFALTHGLEFGWTSPIILALFAVFVIGALAFYFAEHRDCDPLVNFGFFYHPHYVAATIGMFVASFAMWGLIYYYNIFVQSPETMEFSAVGAGLSMLPLSGLMFVCSVSLPRLLERYGLRWPIAIGMLCLALGSWLLHLTLNETPYSATWWKLLFIGFGLGLTIPLLPRLGLRVIPDADAGQGSGVINTCLYFGGAVGIASSGIITAHIRNEAVAKAIADLKPKSGEVGALVRDLAHGSASQIHHALSQFNPDDAAKAQKVLQDITDDGFSAVMLQLAIVALIGAAVCLWLGRGPVKLKG
ncbi:MAG: MFS transporter [Hyphomicrobiaceae bacterium]